MSNIGLVETDSNILLNKILEKLERIENRLEKAEELLYEGKNVFTTSIDSIDSIMTNPGKNQAVEKIQILVNKLTSNEILNKFILVIEKFEKISPLLENNNLILTIADTFDDIAIRLKDSGIELSTVFLNLLKILPKILDEQAIGLVSKLLEETILLNSNENFNSLKNDLQSVITVDNAQKIIEGIKISNQEINNLSEKPGLLDIIKLLNNPEVRNNIYFSLLAFKTIGNSLKK